MKRLITMVAAAALLAGCANPYAKFYQGAPDARTTARYIPPAGPVQIFTMNDFPRDKATLQQRGFVQVGSSNFSGAADKVTRDQLIEQAQKIGAEVVLANSKYSHTVTGAVPLTLPTTNTSYSTGRATAYGSNGSSVTAYGSGTTTTYGSQTTMMPYSVDRSDFGAVYFVRVRPRIGFYVVPLTDQIKHERGSNAGVLVDIVVDDSPAFKADLLPGDVLLSVNDQAIGSVAAFNQMAPKGDGPVKFSVFRDGKTIEKTVMPMP